MLWLLPFLFVVFLQAQPSAVELLEKVTISKVDALGGVVGFAAVDFGVRAIAHRARSAWCKSECDGYPARSGQCGLAIHHGILVGLCL